MCVPEWRGSGVSLVLTHNALASFTKSIFVVMLELSMAAVISTWKKTHGRSKRSSTTRQIGLEWGLQSDI